MVAFVLATCRHPPIDPPDDPPLAAALQAAGCRVLFRPWTDIEPTELASGTAVVLRSTWDYHRQPARFLAWLAALEKTGVTVLNPPSLVRLTINKSYLTEERPFGCRAPVTIAVSNDADAVSAEVRARGWHRFVVKPPVSAGADGTFLLHADDVEGLKSALKSQRSPILVQEFLPEIQDGELSLIFFDGRFSHAVRKCPAPGDFRVQTEFGSRTAAVHPPSAVITAACGTLLNLPDLPCYARVDGVMRGKDFLLMELELIEPELFLSHSPGAPVALADAILRRCQPAPNLRP